MSIALISVGKLREKPYRMMADEYLKRLSRFGKIEEIEIQDLSEPENSSEALEDQIKLREGTEILQRLKPNDYVVALTIPGKKLDSPQLAERIGKLRIQGYGRIIFIIGGSLGLGSNILARANEEISMSAMTFPHQLAKVMLLEQLYRAEKILAGERYHK